MRVRVLLFASLRDAAGARSLDVELDSGSTVQDCAEALVRRFPSLAERLPRVRTAVGEALVDGCHGLKEGDEVAFLPPVSGGAPEEGLEVEVSEGPISLDRVLESVRRPDCGGIVLFAGTVRDSFAGQVVEGIEYEAHVALACRSLEEIAREVRQRWPVGAVTIIHRRGRLGVGEVSVAIAVSAPHRAEAFEAARHAIDRVKEVVPVWKRELMAGGDVWIEGDERIPAAREPHGQGRGHGRSA